MACSLTRQIPPSYLTRRRFFFFEPSNSPIHTCALSPNFTGTTTGGGYNRHSRSDHRRRSSPIVYSSRCGEQYEYESRRSWSGGDGDGDGGGGGGGGLNSPLEPKSPAGRSLCRVLMDEPGSFDDEVCQVLRRLCEDRDAAASRMKRSSGSDEADLHRRIAELQEKECQIAVEDVMYMMVFYKFSEIKVPLIPRLQECLYNGRLEILPSKDWQLESIHNNQVLQMIREYLTVVLGWKVGSGVVACWSTTQVEMGHLSRLYAASVLFGFFLKSASLRQQLERSLPRMLFHDDLFGKEKYEPEPSPFLLGDLFFDRIQNASTSTAPANQVSSASGNQHEDFRCYLLSFGPETIQACAKPSSHQAMNLIENHCSALFWDNSGSEEPDELIITSLSSLKRLLLEAIAFGSFLWEAERQVEKVYRFQS